MMDFNLGGVIVFAFLAIVIGSIIYATVNLLITNTATKHEDKIGCLGIIGITLFLKFVLPAIFLIIIIGAIIYNHDSQIP